jgi:hypothetical protein
MLRSGVQSQDDLLSPWQTAVFVPSHAFLSFFVPADTARPISTAYSPPGPRGDEEHAQSKAYFHSNP